MAYASRVLELSDRYVFSLSAIKLFSVLMKCDGLIAMLCNG
jgi:hypothetical protein